MGQLQFDGSEVPNEEPQPGAGTRVVLLLGNVDHQGITDALKAGGEEYRKKILASKPENWQTIIALFDSGSVRASVAKLNSDVYRLLLDPRYVVVRNHLMQRIAASRHVVFVYEDLLSDRSERGTEDSENRHHPIANSPEALDREEFQSFRKIPPEITLEVNTFLRGFSLNLMPYRRNADLTVMATDFLRDALEHLLFRIYVPQGRLWANEIDRILQLFRDYLLKTGRKGIRLDQVRTDLGISYEFHDSDESLQISLASDFSDFSEFLDLCLTVPSEAEALLRKKNVAPMEISEILTRYSKEARRLQVDLKQDRERKLLGIRHRLENELAETLPPDIAWADLDALVATVFPDSERLNFSRVLEIGQQPTTRILALGASTINIDPQIINTVRGVVAEQILGNVTLTNEDEKLLELINEHGGAKSVELNSAVHQLSDGGVPPATRLVSAQKLKEFLWATGKKIGDVGLHVLQSYIEKRLGLQ